MIGVQQWLNIRVIHNDVNFIGFKCKYKKTLLEKCFFVQNSLLEKCFLKSSYLAAAIIESYHTVSHRCISLAADLMPVGSSMRFAKQAVGLQNKSPEGRKNEGYVRRRPEKLFCVVFLSFHHILL